MAVRVHVPGHKHYDIKKEVDQGDWTYSKKKFDIDIANTESARPRQQ